MRKTLLIMLLTTWWTDFSDDGCHPNPDTYFFIEELVLKAIGEALK